MPQESSYDSKPALGISARPFSPGVIAVVCGVTSAVGYTLTNICLKVVQDVDPVWVSCVKAIPTVIGVTPFVLTNIARKKRAFPSGKVLWIVLAVALLSQFGGNVAFQWALHLIGLALDVPITLGMMIVSGAILGRIFLGDPITLRMMVAGIILIIATCVLSAGASKAQKLKMEGGQHGSPSVERHAGATEALAEFGSLRHDDQASKTASDGWAFLFGVLAACTAGVSYCCMSTVVRYAATKGADRMSLVGVICLVGVVSLGGFAIALHGPSIVFVPTADQYKAMFLAGVFNYLAFIALAKALELASVFFVNALSTCQVLMSAIAGIMLFGERATVELGLGIVLISIGLLSMKSNGRK